jgi:HNH endonuclease
MNSRAKGNWQGMNWIRQEKRMAIYLRDGCACAWCGKGVEQGAQLSLDHIVAHSRGGSNNESNLVTSCMDCNRSRSARSAAKFADIIAAYLNHGIEGKAILANVRKLSKRSLKPYMTEAKELISRRGSAFAVLTERN